MSRPYTPGVMIHLLLPVGTDGSSRDSPPREMTSSHVCGPGARGRGGGSGVGPGPGTPGAYHTSGMSDHPSVCSVAPIPCAACRRDQGPSSRGRRINVDGVAALGATACQLGHGVPLARRQYMLRSASAVV